MNSSRAPLTLAIVLLLLPVLYVGSYAAMIDRSDSVTAFGRFLDGRSKHYRAGGPWVDSFFWPVERVDRTLRPRVWEVLDLSHYGGGATQMELPDVTPAQVTDK